MLKLSIMENNRYFLKSKKSLTKKISQNEFFNYFIAKIHKINYNKNLEISEKLNLKLKNLEKKILEEKSEKKYFSDLLNLNSYKKNDLKKISLKIEQINNLIKFDLIQQKFFFFSEKKKNF